MKVSLQAFILPDLLMDLCMLLTAQLVCGPLRPLRLLAAAAALTGCSRLAGMLDLPSSAAFALSLPVFFLCARIATGERRPGRILEASACMFCAGAAAAGFVMLTNRAAVPAGIPGILLLLILLRRRRHENYRWNIEVYVEMDGLGAFLPALIDTGNRLREHRSGLPVLIAEARALSPIAQSIQSLAPERLRVLPYGVLGSTGEISCFRPDKLEIILPGTGRRSAPPCWVAVYPDRIPGSMRALAPPAFIKVLE